MDKEKGNRKTEMGGGKRWEDNCLSIRIAFVNSANVLVFPVPSLSYCGFVYFLLAHPPIRSLLLLLLTTPDDHTQDKQQPYKVNPTIETLLPKGKLPLTRCCFSISLSRKEKKGKARPNIFPVFSHAWRPFIILVGTTGRDHLCLGWQLKGNSCYPDQFFVHFGVPSITHFSFLYLRRKDE